MENNKKQIGDMYLAAAYLAYGCNLVQVNRDNPRRLKFVFDTVPVRIYVLQGGVVRSEEMPTLDDVEIRFVGRTLCFPPGYDESIKRIKTIIHSDG